MTNVNKKNTEGFTLIELMIVVAIIAIIAAIAIPNLLNARMAGNEASAVSSLRTLSTVCEQSRNRDIQGAYPVDFAELGAENYIDDSFATAVNATTLKSGYFFTYSVSGSTWDCVAAPGTFDTDGGRYFRVSEAGVIEQSEDNSTWVAIQ
ncbi:MAG: prepilin-type N-terminal cleavage/methylation domain-containing protein [Planctomycetia bacterium]|nr:prepilin-type N-terminal cleavage/methylation domain-containing protein [Planctomycetia bacterium]NCG13729.1 prepilin-type N-terminal cleavage/methylation domain-containing protein [Planctomycetia bacterium]